MYRLVLPLVAVYAVACDCGPDNKPACTLASSDIRVDKIPENGDEIESGGSLMCVAGSGKIYVAWIDDRTGTDAIWFNSSTDGGVTWLNSDVQVNQGDDTSEAASHVFQPAIACTDEAVYVAWEDDRDGELENHNIYFQVSEDNGETWQEQDILVDDDPDGRFFSKGPFIAATDTTVYVAWFDLKNGSYDIYINHSSTPADPAEWGTPVRVDSDEPAGIAYSAYPRVAADDNGTVIVVWEDARSGKNDIYAARSVNAAETFDLDVRLDSGTTAGGDPDDPGTAQSFSPQVAMDGQNVYVAWFDGRNAELEDGPRDIYANYSANGGIEWRTAAVAVEDPEGNSPGFFNSRFPVLAVKGNEAVIAWEDDRADGYDIYARKLVNGEPQAPETRLDGGNTTFPSDRGTANSLNTRIASSGSNVVVMWADDRSSIDPESGFADLYYNCSSDFGDSWDAEDLRVDNVTEGSSFKLDLNVALVGQTIYAAWADGRTGSSDIWFHTLEKGTEADYVIEGDPNECVREEPVDEGTAE
jgi:hypothetical protein